MIPLCSQKSLAADKVSKRMVNVLSGITDSTLGRMALASCVLKVTRRRTCGELPDWHRVVSTGNPGDGQSTRGVTREAL